MQDNRENHENKDLNKPVSTISFNGNHNEDHLQNQNSLQTHRGLEVTTKVSKLVYDPPQSSRAIVKNSYTYYNKPPLNLVTESSPVESENIKNSTFKTRDNNKFPEKKSNEISDVANPINKNNDFQKKRIEREKDIEDIQKMLKQINNCNENDDEYKTHDNINQNVAAEKRNSKDERHSPVNAQIETNLNNNAELSKQLSQLNIQTVENHKKNDLIKSPTSLDINMRRSFTDMNIKTKFLMSPKKPISSRTGTNRSKTSINLLSHGNNNEILETTMKKKSYDPSEARQFMKEQRKKRNQLKNEQKNTSTKNKNTTATAGNVDKEAIKKRLEELRKNTLKIIEKNVKIKDKCKTKKTESLENIRSPPNSAKSNKSVLKPSNSKGTLNLEKSAKNADKIINKKIGLLRKPEDEENSFSALKNFDINKENLNFNMKTPNLIDNTQTIDQNTRKVSDTVIYKKVSESKFENNSKLNEFELKIPDKKLERKVSVREKFVQVDPQLKPTPTFEETDQKDLPYWLKPTPVQYYPYNFIMAVRKKLEALTKPTINDNNKQRNRSKVQEMDNVQETPLSYQKDRKEVVRRRITKEKSFNLIANESPEQNTNIDLEKETKNINNMPSVNCKSLQNEKDNFGHSSKSISELTSNFSSISINVPGTHTISDISSIRSEIASNKVQKSHKPLLNSTKISAQHDNNILNKLNFIHEDDTTISSSVFSSPEKKINKPNSTIQQELITGPLSPLSVDNVNKLQIKQKSNLDKVNLQRGSFSKPQLPLNVKPNVELKENKNLSSKTSSSQSTKKSENLDFSQLLEDFNKSLSQVIEVNEQLKETIKKSNEMLSPNKKKLTARTMETENYTSDFENDFSGKFKLNSKESKSELNKKTDQTNTLMTKGSIQSKTDEYTSDFEEEPNSLNNVGNSTSQASINTAISEIFKIPQSEVTLQNIPQPQLSLVSIPERIQSIPQPQLSLISIPEKHHSISSNTTKSTEKYDDNINNPKVVEENEINKTHTSQEYLDSIEEISKMKTASISDPKTETIYKNKEVVENIVNVEENSIEKNQEINQIHKNSMDSTVSQSNSEFIKNHINISRGDFIDNQQNDGLKMIRTLPITESNIAPPAYIVTDKNQTEEATSSTIGSDFIAVFNSSDIELSIYSHNESTVSEATLNYSSIGMYEKLLQTETCKSDQLATLLKMREKALMDRTKGQIAWLEVQKEKYKTKGSPAQISHIRKKQRAVLMKMEKEREEIKKLIQTQKNQLSTRSNISGRQLKIYSYLPKLAENTTNISIRKNSNKILTSKSNTESNSKIIRGFEIQSNQNLEKILGKREEELRKRRAHVECLMEWHKRLDKEEEEVFQLERLLFKHNVIPIQEKGFKPQHPIDYQTKKDIVQIKKDKKIFEIDKSLRELQNISTQSIDSVGNQNPDYVRITGIKLNKLWNRLTGQKNIEKFDGNKKFKLYKKDLEKLYEEAREEVLREFDSKQQNMMELFEQKKCLETSAASLDGESNIIIPKLNLNFSSGQSDIEYNTNGSSIFYESTIQKQIRSSDSIENIQKSNLKDEDLILQGSLLEMKSEKTENEIRNSDRNQHQKSPTKEISNEISLPQDDIKNSIIIQEIPVKNGSITGFLTDAYTLTDKNKSSTSKLTKTTEMSEITAENKTSDDVTSISLEEQNQLENKNSKLKSKEEISHACSKKIQTNVEEIVQDIITNNLLVENSDIDTNVDRPSVIVTQISEKNSEELLKNVINSTDSNLTEKLTESRTVQYVISSPVEDMGKFSEETFSNFTEEVSKSDKLIIDNSNTENVESKQDCTVTLVKSDTIKSEIENFKENSTEKNITETETDKSISSTILLPPRNLNITKQIVRSPQSISNDTHVIPEQNSNNSPTLTNSPVQTLSLNELQKNNDTEDYENDFSGSEMTFLDDITAPKFELTMEETKLNLDESNLEVNKLRNDEKSLSTSELEKRLIDLDVSLKDLHSTFDRALSPDKNLSTPPSTPLLLSPPTTVFNKSLLDDSIIKLDLEKVSLPSRNNYLNTNENKTTLMPDILNEVEIRRRQQILIESEIKQFDQTVPPYVFLREIPNKPPPPYVPPAHGSPMTIIFPSEQRIKEITFRRTHELYNEILKTDKNTDKNDIKDSTSTTSKSNSILDENITNIYERIILDICKECMQEYKKVLTNLNPETYKNSLALFNPPDRLKCMQEFVYRNVRKLLSMEKKSNILQKNSIISIGRKKRDHVDEILIQELYEEEHKWTNFDQEEDEVKLAIVDEILNDIIKSVIGEIADINEKKMEFLTNFSSVNINK